MNSVIAGQTLKKLLFKICDYIWILGIIFKNYVIGLLTPFWQCTFFSSAHSCCPSHSERYHFHETVLFRKKW